jgi:hypothetical protein
MDGASEDTLRLVELLKLPPDLFIAVITSATEIGNTRPTGKLPESVAKIHEVNFYCLTSAVWDDLSLVGDAPLSPSYAEHVDVIALRETRPADSYQQNINAAQPAPPVFEHPCSALKKILSSGSFYYALGPHWDISSRLPERLSRDRGEADLGAFDDRFVWNEYIVRSLLDFRERLDLKEREDLDRCQFVVSAARLQHLVSVNVLSVHYGIGPCNPRLRRRVHDPAPCAPNEWHSDHRNAQSDFPLGRKARRDALQHARRRRRWEHS